MKMFKGFNKDMTCRGYRFEEGGEYHEDKADLCSSGFHACERPLDCFAYYAPGQSVYREVDLGEVSEQTESDTKRVGKTIKIGAALDIAGLCKAQFEYVKSHTTMDHTDAKQATAGNYGAATAGNSGAATSRGKSSVGASGIACARGNGCMVRGGIGSVLVIAEEKESNYNISAWKAVVVDGEEAKADTWYMLKDGELIEVDENA